MLEEVSCINYKIAIADEIGNSFKVDRICLEKDQQDKKIIYYVRLFVVVCQQNEVMNKELFFELEKLQGWLYSMYSIGPNRKKCVKLEMDENIVIKLAIIDEQKAKLIILNKSENLNFELISSLEDFRTFQQSWKRAISIL